MKKSLFLLLVICFSGALGSLSAVQIVPQPQKCEVSEGQFVFNSSTRWVVENAEQQAIAQVFAEQLNTVGNYVYQASSKRAPKRNVVVFKHNASLAAEAYTLDITSTSIRIEASSQSGYFYALQSLRQLLPAELELGYLQPEMQWAVPCVRIEDAPRFAYRGFMLDVSRHFQPVEEVKKLIDVMAMHKLNTFHWHLVDDNGWRIEIKQYPKLTDVGAWNSYRTNLYGGRANQEEGEATTEGGYYTQDDVREIVAYAAERSIEVIPEIEMPAHTNSSLAAYSHLACPVVSDYISVLPGIGGNNSHIIYCAGNDSVFDFLENILDEVMQLFPSKYIHVGGDEANKYYWERCPKCQQRMKEEGIPSEEELQSYFMKRMNRYIQAHGRQMMGWDELVDSEIPDNTVIFGWRGQGTAAEKAGRQGFQYIKSPAQYYYFIRYQGPQWFEPFTYFGNTTLADVYAYEPLPAESDDILKQNMLGVEACLWSEFVTNERDAEYMIFPRLAAYAESAWTQPELKNWNEFLPRLDATTERYKAMDVTYSEAMYNIQHVVKPKDGRFEVTLTNIRPDVDMHYTLDGSEPKVNAPIYSGAIIIEPATTVRARVFKGGKALGHILSLNTIAHQAAGCTVKSNEVNAYVLTNGLLGTQRKTDGEWVDCYDKDAEFIIDLGAVKMFEQVTIGALNDAGMCIYQPRELRIFVSTDGMQFTQVLAQTFEPHLIFQNGIFRKMILLKVEAQEAQYIRVEAFNPGLTPEWVVREGSPTRFALDEIVVK